MYTDVNLNRRTKKSPYISRVILIKMRTPEPRIYSFNLRLADHIAAVWCFWMILLPKFFHGRRKQWPEWLVQAS